MTTMVPSTFLWMCLANCVYAVAVGKTMFALMLSSSKAVFHASVGMVFMARSAMASV